MGAAPGVVAKAEEAVAGLRARDAEPALAWVRANKARASSAGGVAELEFALRAAQMGEMVREGRRGAAVAFARQHMAPLARGANRLKLMPELQAAMGRLTRAELADEPERWSTELVGRLLEAVFRVHALTSDSLLEICLAAGIAAVRTASCTGDADSPSHNAQCPTCREDVLQLARNLPSAAHATTLLRCRLTGEFMEDPAALPNGQVYSFAGLQAQSAARGDGAVQCLVTGSTFPLSGVRRAFFV